MKYRLKNKNYCTFRIFEQNRMAPRAYFIPFSEKEKALSSSPLSARYESDIVTCLSGKWDFRFYKDPSTLEDVFDTDALTFDSVSVPSVGNTRDMPSQST